MTAALAALGVDAGGPDAVRRPSPPGNAELRGRLLRRRWSVGRRGSRSRRPHRPCPPAPGCTSSLEDGRTGRVDGPGGPGAPGAADLPLGVHRLTRHRPGRAHR
ncbi:hypothetical protein LT493_02730 [Streptomyces tricolor]|nr:hypothetical protein [Streptomyces tricolor]